MLSCFLELRLYLCASRRYWPDLLHFAFHRKAKLRSCRHQAGGKQMSTGHLYLGLQICQCRQKKKHTKRCVSLLLLVCTIDIPRRNRYRPDLLHFAFHRKAKLRSCRHRAGSKQMSTGHLHLGLQICQCRQKRNTPNGVFLFLEVPARFELANNGFADRGLTTWLRYHMK